MGKISPSALDIISVTGGTLPIEDTSAHNDLTGICIECVADAVVSACTGFDSAGNAFDFKASRNFVNLYAGSFYYVRRGYYIASITLAGGKVSIHEF